MSAILIGLLAMQAAETIGPPPTQAPPVPREIQPSQVLVPMLPPSPLPPPLQLATAPKTPPSPRNSPQDWVTADDYPPAALRAGHSGTTGFILTINTTGSVVACAITATSGSAILDAATCNLLIQRAQFNPARDARGRPVAATWRSRFRWEMPEPDPSEASAQAAPLLSWTRTVRFTIGPDGAIGDCRTSSYGANDFEMTDIAWPFDPAPSRCGSDCGGMRGVRSR